MRAFHCNWTRPFFARNPDGVYQPETTELLTTALSALLWRRENGTIAMLCDTPAANFYTQHGLTDLWDDGVQTVLDAVDDDINPLIFWAAGKLYALRAFGTPCVMLDTDFIVWQSLVPLLEGSTLACIHREDLMPDVYPPAEALPAFPAAALAPLNWSVRPANTALAFFGDPAFTEQYTALSIDLMRHATDADNTLTYMVFAEQRLLAMLAAQSELPLRSLSDLPTLFGSKQQYFTHVWGFKQQMRDNPQLLDDFCRRCAARLAREFPQESAPLRCMPTLAPYFL